MNVNTIDNVERITNWNDYSESFQSVMPPEMERVNDAISKYMVGNVADFGCGSGKVIPYILRRPKVAHYTGIDSAAEMISRAQWMANQFDNTRVTLIQSKIEEMDSQMFDSGLSINSHYIWPEPKLTLSHILGQLKPGATFVLATINSSLDMPALLDEATPAMVAHPHWEAFKNHNLKICNSSDINLYELDSLIEQVREVGFAVLKAHDDWYMGGLNTLVLKRP